jgi:hypothetical protein
MPDNRPVYLASDVDLKLRLGIFRLLNAKYRPSFGDQSKFLCAGMLNCILLEPPGNEDASSFLEMNKDLIEREATTLSLDPKLSLAISLLYTLALIRLGPKNPERSKASRLSNMSARPASASTPSTAVRHAKESGITLQEMEHVVMLSITTLGFPAAGRALAWIHDSATL